MGALEDFPVSEMAKNMARREATEAATPSDPIEKLVSLIGSATNGLDERAVYSDYAHLHLSEKKVGEILAVKLLVEAGVAADDKLVEALKERVMMRSLGASAFFEAQLETEGRDIRSLYIEEDGGNG